MANESLNKVYLCLGSNLGSRFVNIKEAISRIRRKMDILEISDIDETEPVGYKSQPRFLNCVLKAQTSLSPRELLNFLKGIERGMGRVKNFRNGPRIIDIDILFYNDIVVEEDGLELPHPRIDKREFVLKPMAQIEPSFMHPSLGKEMAKLLKEIRIS